MIGQVAELHVAGGGDSPHRHRAIAFLDQDVQRGAQDQFARLVALGIAALAFRKYQVGDERWRAIILIHNKFQLRFRP
jgi:hypothetical protein